MGCLPPFLTTLHTKHTSHRQRCKAAEEARRRDCAEALRAVYSDAMETGPAEVSGSSRSRSKKSKVATATVRTTSTTSAINGPQGETGYSKRKPVLTPYPTREPWATEAQAALRAVETWSWTEACGKPPVSQPPMAQKEMTAKTTPANLSGNQVVETRQDSRAIPSSRFGSKVEAEAGSARRLSRKCSLAPPQVVKVLPQFSVAPRTMSRVVGRRGSDVGCRSGSGSGSAESEMDVRRVSEWRAFGTL
ncbi:hypothetical protein LTR86_007674 [Recurvomyces mirabilis]|nr:hypothetical protein LTR86_007674 [Recurvomyces mirabilis]